MDRCAASTYNSSGLCDIGTMMAKRKEAQVSIGMALLFGFSLPKKAATDAKTAVDSLKSFIPNN